MQDEFVATLDDIKEMEDFFKEIDLEEYAKDISEINKLNGNS